MRPQTEYSGEVLGELDDSHGKRLKDIALVSIRSHLSGMRYRPRINDPILREKMGIYVTLERDGELRGCAGFVYPTYEMWAATKKAAVHAAFQDAMFNKVERKELESLEIEITVLGSIEKLKMGQDKDSGLVNMGIDGLMVIGRGSSGILLPQTAEDMNLTSIEFLSAACEKAGLPPDSWKESDVSVYRFPTRVF